MEGNCDSFTLVTIRNIWGFCRFKVSWQPLSFSYLVMLIFNLLFLLMWNTVRQTLSSMWAVGYNGTCIPEFLSCKWRPDHAVALKENCVIIWTYFWWNSWGRCFRAEAKSPSRDGFYLLKGSHSVINFAKRGRIYKIFIL